MPTFLLRSEIPDYPNNDQEICHLFSANYLFQSRANGHPNYIMPQNGIDSINFLFNAIHKLKLQRNNGPIQPGNLIIIGTRNNVNPHTAIANVTHSMIAINSNIWFGCNNLNTFAQNFIQLQIPANSLFSRREIDMAALDVDIDYNNRTFGGLSFDVWH